MELVEIQHGSAGLVFDPDGFRFSMLELPSGRIRDSVVFQSPFRAMYEGHEIVVSPNGGHAALFLFAGETEHAWELFALRPKLARRKGSPVATGRGEAPVFSPDSKYLVTASTAAIDWFDENVEFAELYVQTLATEEVKRYGLRVNASLEAGDDPEEWAQPNELVFEAPGLLRVTLPWDESATITIPPSGPVTFIR